MHVCDENTNVSKYTETLDAQVDTYIILYKNTVTEQKTGVLSLVNRINFILDMNCHNITYIF